MENEWSLWFHLQGLIIGIATFLIIGLFHPLVVKAEYYWGTNSRWAFFALGIIGIIASIWVNNLLVSALCGVTAFSSFWSIREITQQQERVHQGWFPQNPNRRYPWDKDSAQEK